ncbi:MAG TPA: biotin/lipoyl-containing protein [Kofleriaceae bacterium]|nr:biotin/lipoyl-containing protein [Kofleriaceae bacterium]
MRHELSAMLGGREVAISVERGRDGGWRVSVDGAPERPVDAVEIRPGTWSILLDGRSLLVDVDRRAAGTALLVAGEEVAIELADARKRRLAQAVAGRPAATGELIRAPIAGRVVKLLVAVGDTVTAGQGVAVLEAMKMENEIRADRGGTVSAVGAQAGQSVETGALLLTLT